MSRATFIIMVLLCLSFPARGQVQTPYILNGSATQRTCNCYVLTQDVNTSSGTVWNKNQIDLRNSFDYFFDVNLGCKDYEGADGIGFILQTKGTNLGATGSGIGFQGISPSLGIIIDTYQNPMDNDPAYDHLAIQMNGVTDHNATNNLAGPVTALDGNDNIEDCSWHIFRIKWDAAAMQMTVSMDGVLRLSLDKDIVRDIFSNSPMVYWGFAGSTGGSYNVQQFCAALRPQLDFSTDQRFCIGDPIEFRDSSKSFGTITRWQWNFGDGTTSTVSQPGVHQYAKPGVYDVTMVIEDNSGCISDTMHQRVTIGTYPVAEMSTDPLCLGRPLTIKDKTTLEVGTLTEWDWELNGHTGSGKNIVADFTTPGTYPVKLSVLTKEGCADDTIQLLSVYDTPAITAGGGNACIGDAIDFSGTNLTPGIAIASWHWNFGDGNQAAVKDIDYTYKAGGTYTAGLYAVSRDGCLSDSVWLPVKIVDVALEAGRDTLIAKGQPLQLNAVATGDDLAYSWYPPTGLNDVLIPDPVAVVFQDMRYVLIVTSPEGCVQMDTLLVKAYTGPEFYVPGAFSPNHDGKNDLFRAIAAGVPQLDFLCVWDRWGKEIFRTSSLTGAWDGTFKGEDSPVGTYVYQIQGTDYMGRKFSRKGTVTLVR